MVITCQDLSGVFCGLQVSGWDDKLNTHQQRVSTDWMFDMMSFMHTRNSTGPSTDP